MIIKLVWRITPDTLFETQWIRELLALGEVTAEEIRDLDGTQVIPRAIIVVNHGIDYEAYLNMYHDKKVPYGVIHLSDETLTASTKFYASPYCLFVFRNYHHPMLPSNVKNKVVTFGLGYKNGFANTHPLPQEKYYLWSFAGNVHTPERMAAVQPFEQLVPHRVHTTTDGFNSASGLSTEAYRKLLDDSKFVICPIGQGNIDSFRVYEALEAGAIPVVLANTQFQPYIPSYWHSMFPWIRGSIPMLIHNDWQQAAETVKAIVQDREQYVQLRDQAASFWKEAKKIWGTTLGLYCLMFDSVIHEDLS